jgi:hypothetical protein
MSVPPKVKKPIIAAMQHLFGANDQLSQARDDIHEA